MKKVIVLLFALGLLIAGCCTSPTNSRKTFGNCVAKVLSPVKNVLCPPNQQQVDQAAAAAAFLASLFGRDYTTQIALAEQIFLDVAAKVCVGLDQLEFALGQFDAVAEVIQGQAMLRGVPVTVKVPDVSALRAALKK